MITPSGMQLIIKINIAMRRRIAANKLIVGL
jgi:hypothetical protein